MTRFTVLKLLKQKKKKLPETGSTLEHGIWGNLNMCSQAMVTQNCSRINSVIPIKMRAVFFFSHLYAPYLIFSYAHMPQHMYISMYAHTCCRRNQVHHHGLRSESFSSLGAACLSQKPPSGFSVAEALTPVSLGLTFSFWLWRAVFNLSHVVLTEPWITLKKPSLQATPCFSGQSTSSGRGPELPCWPAQQFESWKLERKETGRSEVVVMGEGWRDRCLSVSFKFPHLVLLRAIREVLVQRIMIWASWGGVWTVCGHQLMAELPQGYCHLYTQFSPCYQFSPPPSLSYSPTTFFSVSLFLSFQCWELYSGPHA